ncbi:MAG: hypothetical protein Q4D62_15045 [Planctomycetia bacterium]|nr:hypothetical protein [Planctomycetia bacterium]
MAERAGERIESLLTCRLSGGLTDEIQLWLKEIQETPLYNKLAALGLVEEKKPERTFYGLMEAYQTSQSDVTTETHQTYLKVFHNLREFFREDIPLSNITKETAEGFIFGCERSH